jgi:hypothetical protein
LPTIGNKLLLRSLLALKSLAIEDYVSRFSWIASRTYFTTFAWHKVFRFFIIPMWIGCTKDVELGDRNSSWIFYKVSKWGCAAQLSRTSKTFIDFYCNFTSQLITRFLKMLSMHFC